MQVTWSVVRIFESSRIETLLEFDQVDILVGKLAKVNFFTFGEHGVRCKVHKLIFCFDSFDVIYQRMVHKLSLIERRIVHENKHAFCRECEAALCCNMGTSN